MKWVFYGGLALALASLFAGGVLKVAAVVLVRVIYTMILFLLTGHWRM